MSVNGWRYGMQEEHEIRVELLEQSSPYHNRIVKYKKAEKASRESKRKWLLLKKTCDVVLNLDRDGTILFINPPLPGYTIQDTIGLSVYNFIPPKQHKKTRKAIKEVFKTGEVVSFKTSVFEPDGNLLRYTTNLSPVKNCDKVVCVAQVFTKINECKKMENKLRESEEKFRLAMEATNDALWDWNMVTNEVYRNPRHATMLGYKPHEITASQDEWEKRIHPDDKGLVFNILKEHFAGKKVSFNVEYRLRTKKGDYIWVLGRGKIVAYSDDGSPMRMIGTNIDITARKKAEEEIRKLRYAIEQSIDGIWIGDLEAKTLYANDAFARMHGYAHKNIIGMPVEKLYEKKNICELKNRIEQIKIQGAWEGETSHIRKDGTAFPVYMSVTLLKNNEDNPIGMSAVTRDITESKQKEKKLNIYREKMVRTKQLASLGVLSATMAHELTQPITVIRLSIQNSLAELETISCPSTVLEDLKKGLSEISNFISIINRFRNFARISPEKTTKIVDLGEVADRIMELLDENAWRAKVTLQVKGMDMLPPIYSYEKDLERLYYSLVENSIQAADGKKSRQVIISSAIKDGHIELQFSDNCGGIAPKNLKRIFEPFFTTKDASERTGLGLCVVERIVSKLKGKIRVESKLGRGSTFFITLPIK